MIRISNELPAPARWSEPTRWTGFVRTLGAAASLPGRWLHRVRSRRVLLTLSARELGDIGLTPEAARREAALPFWR